MSPKFVYALAREAGFTEREITVFQDCLLYFADALLDGGADDEKWLDNLSQSYEFGIPDGARKAILGRIEHRMREQRSVDAERAYNYLDDPVLSGMGYATGCAETIVKGDIA